jgi:NodT family efflux transporter outer membrane factor (OMF) lipoprotein
MRRASLVLSATLIAALLAGCSFAPPYKVPPTPQPLAFKEAGPWTLAAPADSAPRGPWWTVFGDATLDALEAKLDADNPTLAQALARYDQARAYFGETQSALLPHVGGAGYVTDNRQSDHRPLRGAHQPDEYAANALGLSIDYELDVWGRVRNLVAAGRAETAASRADVEAVKLGLEAQLALAYLKLRALDTEARLLSDSTDAYAKAVKLTTARHTGGAASQLDVDRAVTQLQTTRAQINDVRGDRALFEHAIASLTGQAASSFALEVAPAEPRLPNIPVVVPSTLLQRRPDIAAAERRVAAANADIGVARAAFFPSISLSGVRGFQNTGATDLFASGNSVWSIGPSIAFSVFDAGRRKAAVEAAKAVRDQAADAYRSRVLQAFQDVEDNLALLNHLADEAREEDEAVDAASRTEALSLVRYREGAVSYLEVVTAQTAALQAKRAALSIADRRREACVRLIRALGGGWG